MIESGSLCRKRKAEDTKKGVAEVFKRRISGMRKRKMKGRNASQNNFFFLCMPLNKKEIIDNIKW